MRGEANNRILQGFASRPRFIGRSDKCRRECCCCDTGSGTGAEKNAPVFHKTLNSEDQNSEARSRSRSRLPPPALLRMRLSLLRGAGFPVNDWIYLPPFDLFSVSRPRSGATAAAAARLEGGAATAITGTGTEGGGTETGGAETGVGTGQRTRAGDAAGAEAG